jgi:hypothetical protein
MWKRPEVIGEEEERRCGQDARAPVLREDSSATLDTRLLGLRLFIFSVSVFQNFSFYPSGWDKYWYRQKISEKSFGPCLSLICVCPLNTHNAGFQGSSGQRRGRGAARPHRPTGVEEVSRKMRDTAGGTPALPLKKRLHYPLPH